MKRQIRDALILQRELGGSKPAAREGELNGQGKKASGALVRGRRRWNGIFASRRRGKRRGVQIDGTQRLRGATRDRNTVTKKQGRAVGDRLRNK